jgi:ferredoxin
MEIKVDDNTCIGCGLCVGLCPALFKMNDEGKSEPIGNDNRECAEQAVASCPVGAISINN